MPRTARQVALFALDQWERRRTFADELLHEAIENSRLGAQDRAFVMEIFLGTLRRLARIDFLISKLREGSLDGQTRSVLRLGLYQLFHMRVAEHAAVNETVNLAGARNRGLINAILRRAIREKQCLESALERAPRAVRLSHPEFLIARWTEQFGQENAEALCEWNNRPADVYVRANGLRVTAGELARSQPGAERLERWPQMLKVNWLPASWMLGGLCYVQDPSTQMACELLAPQPGEQVLDACAAPGGKTTYMAELMDNRGRIVACDLFESRVDRLRENVHRLGARNTQCFVLDTMREHPELRPASFDRILIDAPCSNTGVIRRRVDVRWRLSEEDFIRMPAQQLALIRRCTSLLKPGGSLVYSTCSLEPEENDGVVERATKEIAGLRFIESRRLLPFVDGVDGAFAAKFVRE